MAVLVQFQLSAAKRELVLDPLREVQGSACVGERLLEQALFDSSQDVVNVAAQNANELAVAAQVEQSWLEA